MLAMLLFYLKFLRIASFWESLGVKLKMIYKMVVSDLLPFLLIIGLVVVAFGCCFVGLVYPNGLKSKSSASDSSADVVVLTQVGVTGRGGAGGLGAHLQSTLVPCRACCTDSTPWWASSQ